MKKALCFISGMAVGAAIFFVGAAAGHVKSVAEKNGCSGISDHMVYTLCRKLERKQQDAINDNGRTK